MQLHYFTTGLGHHVSYAFYYGVAQVLNLVNTLVQFFVTDVFLGDSVDFVNYGIVVLEKVTSPAEMSKRIRTRFPYWVNCFVQKTGVSGTTQHMDLLCYLPMNMINGAAFVLFWWWLVFLAVATTMSLLYWLVFICSGRFRRWVLLSQASPFAKELHVGAVAAHFGRSDLLLLLLLGYNMDPHHFAQLVSALATKLDNMPRHQ